MLAMNGEVDAEWFKHHTSCQNERKETKMRVKSLAERDMIASRCETRNIQISPQIMSSLVRRSKIKGQLCHRREWSISSKDSQSRTQNHNRLETKQIDSAQCVQNLHFLALSAQTHCSAVLCSNTRTLLKHRNTRTLLKHTNSALLTHCWIESTAASRDQATSRPAQPLETKTTWNDKTVSCDKEPHLQVQYFRDLLWHWTLLQTTL